MLFDCKVAMLKMLFMVIAPVTFCNCNVVVEESDSEDTDELKLAGTVCGCVFGTVDTVMIEPGLLFSWFCIAVDVLAFALFAVSIAVERVVDT